MIGRVATFSEVNYLMTLNMGTQAQMTTAQTQESSGLKALTYGGLGEDVGQVLNLTNQVASLTSDQTNATQALSGMQETYSVLGSITSLGASMLSTLTGYQNANSTTTTTGTVAASAATWLTQLTSLANTQFGGNYLFSGTSPNTPAVDTVGFTGSAAPTSDTYYKGSPDVTDATGAVISSGTMYTGSDGFTIQTSVQANSQGFQNLFNAVSLIATTAAAGSSTSAVSPALTAAISTAYSLIQTGNTQLAQSQAVVSSNTAALTSYSSVASDKATTLQTLATSLEGSDVATATVQVTTLQTQLESSYETVTKLMSDSLAKYIS